MHCLPTYQVTSNINIGYCITILPYKKIFGTRNPYDNRYGANIVRSGPKNSGDSEAIVITENIVVSGIVIARLYCKLFSFRRLRSSSDSRGIRTRGEFALGIWYLVKNLKIHKKPSCGKRVRPRQFSQVSLLRFCALFDFSKACIAPWAWVISSSSTH